MKEINKEIYEDIAQLMKENLFLKIWGGRGQGPLGTPNFPPTFEWGIFIRNFKDNCKIEI